MINIVVTIILSIIYIALAVLSERTGKCRLFRNICGLIAGAGFMLFGLSFILKKTVSPNGTGSPSVSAADDIFWQIMLPLFAFFVLLSIAAVFVAYSRESRLNSVLRILCIVMSPVLSIFMILMSFLANGLQYMTSVTFASIASLGLSMAVKVMDYIRLYQKEKKNEVNR